MITTLAKVKTYLGIIGTAEDPRLTAILAGVEAFVFNIIGDVSENDKTETINISSINETTETFALRNKKVTKIKTVNGNDFISKVNGVDYLIRADDTVTINDIFNFISDLNFDVFDIVYTSGFTTIPVDLENAVAELVGFTFAKELGKNISSESTGPRKVSYSNDDTTDSKLNSSLLIINNYQVLNLKHFT